MRLIARLGMLLRKGFARLTKSAAPIFSLDSAMLLLLSASFGYSLLSLIVHIVDRSSDERLLVQISPDGKSLLQLRKTGMAILDAQSGQVVDEVRLIGRWKNAISPADERASFLTRGNWSFRGFRRSTSVCVTSNAQIVVVRRFDDTILWWNRQTREHRVIPSSSAGWLHITLDEPHDRFYVESVRSNISARENDALSAIAEIPGLPTKFNAQCNLHVFELSTGKETQVLSDLMIGQPVQGRPALRVRAQAGVLELLDWPGFPLGNPSVKKRFSLDPSAFEEIASAPSAVIRLQEDDLVIENYFPPPHIMGNSDAALVPSTFKSIRLSSSGVSTSIKKFYSVDTKLEVLDNVEGYAATDYHDKRNQPIWRVELACGRHRAVLNDPYDPFNSDFRADYGLSAAKLSDSKIRLARDDGVIFDIDFTAPDKTAAWRVPLLPHDMIPPDAIAIFLAGALAWTVFAWKRRCLFAKQGWVVLISIVTWPFILWGLERGFTNETIAVAMELAAMAMAFIPLLACTIGLFLSAGRSRAIAIAPWLLLAMMAAGAATSVADRESASFLEHFGIRLDWER